MELIVSPLQTVFYKNGNILIWDIPKYVRGRQGIGDKGARYAMRRARKSKIIWWVTLETAFFFFFSSSGGLR